LMIGSAAVLMILVGLFALGRKQKDGALYKWVVMALFGIAIAAALIIGKVTIAPAGTASKAGSIGFNEARLNTLRSEGQPVFLYFTADWCVTCKVNEQAAIDRTETNDAFRKAGMTVMVGDYTRRDPEITRYLAKYGRSGVPLYLYFPPKGEAQILPQILTVDDLTALTK